MLLQALVQYAQTNLSTQLQDEAWEEKPVPYLLELAPDGSFLGPVERKTAAVRGKKTVSVSQMLRVPRSPVNRNMGLYPLLGADDIKYVLGIGPWTKPSEQQNHAERHEAFVKLINEAATITDDAALQACARFYGRTGEVEKARLALKDMKTGSLVALSADGPLVLRPAVQTYWRDHYGKAFSQRLDAGGVGECMISGRFGPIAPTHEKIKGLSSLGGQAAGVSLMSFDKPAFRSYGWDQNQNSPVSPDCAMAYVLALNDLLRPGNGHRKDIAGVGFIFWLKREEDFSFNDLLDRPSVVQVDALLKLSKADPDPNAFYMAGLSGNGGRLRMRYWVEDALPNVKRNLGEWFSGLQVSGFGDRPEPVRFWQLLHVIDREGEPPARRVIALLRRALEGRSQPLGHEMLAAALEPLRHAGKPTLERLGLVRLCVNDLIHVQEKQRGEREMTENLDPEQRNPAYLCGRLFAEYESLQSTAFREAGESAVNVSVADRYYGLASTYPAVAFPKMAVLGKKHLRKLQRDKKGAAVAIDQRIQDLHVLLEQEAGYKFPSILSLEDQGRFALGYYHQRAHSIAQAQARKEEKQRREANGEEK